MVNKKILLDDEQILYKKFCLRLHARLSLFSSCCVLNCDNNDIKIHLVRKLHIVYKIGNRITVLTTKGKQVKGLAAILSILNRKYIIFCFKHHLEFKTGKFLPFCFKTIKFKLGVNLDNLNVRELFYKYSIS
jgi:hypothetical protein